MRRVMFEQISLISLISLIRRQLGMKTYYEYPQFMGVF